MEFLKQNTLPVILAAVVIAVSVWGFAQYQGVTNKMEQIDIVVRQNQNLKEQVDNLEGSNKSLEQNLSLIKTGVEKLASEKSKNKEVSKSVSSVVKKDVLVKESSDSARSAIVTAAMNSFFKEVERETSN